MTTYINIKGSNLLVAGRGISFKENSRAVSLVEKVNSGEIALKVTYIFPKSDKGKLFLEHLTMTEKEHKEEIVLVNGKVVSEVSAKQTMQKYIDSGMIEKAIKKGDRTVENSHLWIGLSAVNSNTGKTTKLPAMAIREKDLKFLSWLLDAIKKLDSEAQLVEQLTLDLVNATVTVEEYLE